MHGYGYLINKSGVYSGFLRGGLKVGRGILSFQTQEYRGMFNNDLFEGFGEIKSTNTGYTFYGQFCKGRATGEGFISNEKDELLQELTFKNDWAQLPNGKINSFNITAKLIKFDGSVYEGQTKKGLPHGKGT